MSDPNALLFGTSIPGIKPEDKLVIRGRIVEFFTRQRRKYDPKQPGCQGPLLWYVNGDVVANDVEPANSSPVMDPVMTIQTGLTKFEYISPTYDRDPVDDGQRRVYITARAKETNGTSLKTVLINAAKKSGCGRARPLDVGDYVEFKVIGQGKPNSQGGNPPWDWACTVWLKDTPPEWASALPTDGPIDFSQLNDDDDNPF